MKKIFNLFILLTLNSCAIPKCCGISGITIQPCTNIADKKEREECNQKEMKYYQRTGWRYERFKRLDQR